MIITIARECGCDGDKIGEKLAEHFSIPFYNKKKMPFVKMAFLLIFAIRFCAVCTNSVVFD